MARITRAPGTPVPVPPAPPAAPVPPAPPAAPPTLDPAAFAAFQDWQRKQSAKRSTPTVDPETGEIDLSALKLSLGNVFVNGTKGLGLSGADLPDLTLSLVMNGRTLVSRTARGRTFSTGTVGWNFGGPGVPLG